MYKSSPASCTLAGNLNLISVELFIILIRGSLTRYAHAVVVEELYTCAIIQNHGVPGDEAGMAKAVLCFNGAAWVLESWRTVSITEQGIKKEGVTYDLSCLTCPTCCRWTLYLADESGV
jgi:hypothetical protein